jgi:hypothetical protein
MVRGRWQVSADPYYALDGRVMTERADWEKCGDWHKDKGRGT